MMILLTPEDLESLLFNHSCITIQNFNQIRIIDDEDIRVLNLIAFLHVKKIIPDP